MCKTVVRSALLFFFLLLFFFGGGGGHGMPAIVIPVFSNFSYGFQLIMDKFDSEQ